MEQNKPLTKPLSILITSGTYPPRVGGAAFYAYNLEQEFRNQGHQVHVLFYKFEYALPSGIRHLLFFIRTLFALPGKDFVLTLDTFSVGVPTVAACKLLRKKVIIRIGGDFLWEAYVNRSEEMVPLPEFYTKEETFISKFTSKERTLFSLTQSALQKANALVFNTAWQRELFIKPYKLDRMKTYVITNAIPGKLESTNPTEKIFFWVARNNAVKNGKILKEAVKRAKRENPEILFEGGEMPYEKMLKGVKQSYAVILPSLSDVSPDFILTAIRYNKPFILTKYTGFPDEIKRLGLLVDPLDRNDIKERILFLADDDVYATYKNKMRQFTFTHTWSEIVNEFLMVYKEL